MKHKTIQKKKVYEENLNEELCNFNPQSFNSSDAPESLRNKETMENSINNYSNSLNKETIFSISTRKNNTTNPNNNNNNNNSNKSSSRERKKKTSRKSSKNSFRDSSALNLDPLPMQSPLISLVDSLKEKLEFYENEVKSLIDEKIQMQMTINNLQMSQMRKSTNNSRNSGKSNNNTINNINKSAFISDNNKALRISHESVFELQNNSIRNDDKFKSEETNKFIIGANNSASDNSKNKFLNVDFINKSTNINGDINSRSFNDLQLRKNSNAINVNNKNDLNFFNNLDKDSLLNSHQDNLFRQKKLLESNNSILEDTINMQNIKDFGTTFYNFLEKFIFIFQYKKIFAKIFVKHF